MNILKSLLTLIGFLVVVAIVIGIVKFDLVDRMNQVSKLDPKALPEYMKMFDKVLKTGDASQAMIRRVKVNADVSNADVAEALESIATERGIKPVGILPLSDEINARTGGNRGYIKIFSYCNPITAGDFVDYSLAFGAFLPCRIALMEDKNGDRWLYAMAMELMIEGGHTLEPEMLKKANNVRKTIYDMMDMAAEGEF
jgi:uncharacterized protein (DUF302 family)